jgi:hypothetical protein
MTGNLAVNPAAAGASVTQSPSTPALIGATSTTGVVVSTTVGASVGVAPGVAVVAWVAGVAGVAGAGVAGAGVALDEPQAERRTALPNRTSNKRRTEYS